ncbi:MAG: hypothetical protein HYZ79_05700, partial [Candidatus Melainabacteria bacterium]|nr:hypothetical protein [Candidatus Melainabacteria bacterium]
KIYREQYGLHDLTLYKGKLYLYFGPVPAVLLNLPFYLFTKHYIPDNLSVFIFAVGILIWGGLILEHIRVHYFKQIPEWIILFGIGVIGFADLAPFLLRRSLAYEVAISSGCFFLLGAIYFIIKGFQGNKLKMKTLMFASLFIGLACGTRLNFILPAAFLQMFILYRILRTEKLKKLLRVY